MQDLGSRKKLSALAPACKIWLCFAMLAAVGATSESRALPIGFGHNQGPLEYKETKSDHFIVYHDARTPNEANLIVNSLEHARPIVEKWLAISRKEPLPVVMTAVADNASFANFLTDAIELQTLGMGGRDLAWHEYTHSSMYRHLENLLGPAGSVIHLLWMPAWFIEGLAETMSVSLISDEQAAVERYQALTGKWTSYDKLHSLYGKGSFAHTGYALSGSFVTWMLRTYADGDKLPKLLRDFKSYSMPWWWPWAVVPFNSFLPMDAGLRDMTGKNGEQLWEEYKAKATAYWKAHSPGPLLRATKDRPASFGNVQTIHMRGNDILQGIRDGHQYKEIKLKVGGEGWVTGWEEHKNLPDNLASLHRIHNTKYAVNILSNSSGEFTRYDIAVTVPKHDKPKTIFTVDGYIGGLFDAQDRVYWLEYRREITQVCGAAKSYFIKAAIIPSKAVSCPLRFYQPQSIRLLAEELDEQSAEPRTIKGLWLARDDATLKGDRHNVFYLPFTKEKPRVLPFKEGGKPIAMAKQGSDYWTVVAGKASRFLRKVDKNGLCLEERMVANQIQKIYPLGPHHLLAAVYEEEGHRLLKLDPNSLPQRACAATLGHSSPLLAAMQSEQPLSLSQALASSSTWEKDSAAAITASQEVIAQAKSGDKDTNISGKSSNIVHRQAQWRGRPVLYFPWIGADALGNQAGFISVPLMDHMQNETMRATFLYGIDSRFPQTEVSLLSTRFSTTLQLDGFRAQAFNGTYRNPETGRMESLYYDEKGGRLTLSNRVGAGYFNYGTKLSTLTPYLGPHTVRRGNQAEFFLNLDLSTQLGSLGWSNSFNSAATPRAVNNNFEYDKLGIASTVSLPIPLFSWRTSVFKLGLAGSRTRGEKPKYLREVYRPLNTFVPGTGGGLNELNFGILGPGLLTSAVYGDTQAKIKTSWSVPIIPDIEKVIGIIYLSRLDVTAFYNYGGAWLGDKGPKNNQMFGAHGYNLDLQADIKGVNLNAGVGTGQVVGEEWEVYFLFGFDAIIN